MRYEHSDYQRHQNAMRRWETLEGWPEVHGYDSGTYDFQMLVGENGHNGDTTLTTYYFFVEVS